MVSQALNPQEGPQYLADLERVIEAGLQHFYAVGCALNTINVLKLYKPQYRTWEEYCLDRWGMSRRHAYRLIDAAKVLDNLKDDPECVQLVTPPDSESVVRPLVDLEPEEQRRIYAEAVKEAPMGRPTAAQVHRLATKALAGLSPEQQLQVVSAAEKEVVTAAKDFEKPNEETARLRRALKHTRKSANACRTMTDPRAGDVRVWLAQAVERLEQMEEVPQPTGR